MSELKQDLAKKVVKRILVDLGDRSGLADAWDDIDSETQREIKKQWATFVEAALDNYKVNIV